MPPVINLKPLFIKKSANAFAFDFTCLMYVLNSGVGNHNTTRYVENFFTNHAHLNPTDIVVHYFLNDAENWFSHTWESVSSWFTNNKALRQQQKVNGKNVTVNCGGVTFNVYNRTLLISKIFS
mgnify:CR=1 FL=1